MVQVPGQGGAAQLTSLTGSSSIKSPDVDAGTLTAVWSLVCDLSRPQRGSSSSSAAAIGTESAEAECGGHTGSAGGTAVGSRVRGAADHYQRGWRSEAWSWWRPSWSAWSSECWQPLPRQRDVDTCSGCSLQYL